jgi:dephospho-CoA kinase
MAAVPPDAVVVHDVPLLVEAGLETAYHLVVVVYAPERMRVARIVADRGLTEEEAWSRVRAQASDEERRAAADVWIDNSGTREATIAQVDECWHERIAWMAEDPPD